MTPDHLEGIKARLRDRLDAMTRTIRRYLAGREAELLYRRQTIRDGDNEGRCRTDVFRGEGGGLAVPNAHGYDLPYLLHYDRAADEIVVIEWFPDSGPRLPEDLPDRMTIGEGLHRIDTTAESLLRETYQRIEKLIPLVPARLRKAVIAREELAARWPWPRDSHPAGFALELLRARANATQAPDAGEARAHVRPTAMGTWPPEVAAMDVATWDALIKAYPDEAEAFRERVTRGESPRRNEVRWIALGVLYGALQAVERDRRRHAMAIDAGRPHHDLLMGVRNLPKDTRTPHTVTAVNDRIELLDPEGGCVQLTLALGESAPSEALISALRTLRTWRGLRHWAAVQKLLSVDGGRQGWVRWTLDGHLDALGVSAKNRTTATVRAEVARQVEAFTRIEIAVYADDGTLRSRRPILLVGEKYDRLTGSEWALDGMQLTINPLLYGGVREAGGQLGSNWHPAPVELAAVNEREHPYTLALGLILPIRWRLALAEGHDHLTLTGESALRLAGITVRPLDRQWMRHNGAGAWAKLERDLEELARIGGLGRWDWDATDTPRTLDGRLHLWPAPWVADRTLHEVRPVELPPGPPVLTGAELKVWRARKGLTQAQAAETLNVSRDSIMRAEKRQDVPLSKALAGKLRAAGA